MSAAAAYVDESFHEHSTDGFYVLAAAVLEVSEDEQEQDQARQVMLALRGGRRTGKLHWTEMDERDRELATQSVVKLDGVHLVTVGAPVPRRGQERARAVSFRQLLFQLHGLGVDAIFMESRQSALDRNDVRLVQQTRHDLPRGTALRVDHLRGTDEPLLWIADIVAGAVRAKRQGDSRYQDLLADQVEVIEVDCG